jgi:hypothetical protein
MDVRGDLACVRGDRAQHPRFPLDGGPARERCPARPRTAEITEMMIRPLQESDIPRWIELRAELWPDQPQAELDVEGRAALVAEPPLIVFVAEAESAILGFLELSLRSYAEGSASSPVPYVEGWFRQRRLAASRCRGVP